MADPSVSYPLPLPPSLPLPSFTFSDPSGVCSGYFVSNSADSISSFSGGAHSPATTDGGGAPSPSVSQSFALGSPVLGLVEDSLLSPFDDPFTFAFTDTANLGAAPAPTPQPAADPQSQWPAPQRPPNIELPSMVPVERSRAISSDSASSSVSSGYLVMNVTLRRDDNSEVCANKLRHYQVSEESIARLQASIPLTGDWLLRAETRSLNLYFSEQDWRGAFPLLLSSRLQVCRLLLANVEQGLMPPLWTEQRMRLDMVATQISQQLSNEYQFEEARKLIVELLPALSLSLGDLTLPTPPPAVVRHPSHPDELPPQRMPPLQASLSVQQSPVVRSATFFPSPFEVTRFFQQNPHLIPQPPQLRQHVSAPASFQPLPVSRDPTNIHSFQRSVGHVHEVVQHAAGIGADMLPQGMPPSPSTAGTVSPASGHSNKRGRTQFQIVPKPPLHADGKRILEARCEKNRSAWFKVTSEYELPVTLTVRFRDNSEQHLPVDATSAKCFVTKDLENHLKEYLRARGEPDDRYFHSEDDGPSVPLVQGTVEVPTGGSDWLWFRLKMHRIGTRAPKGSGRQPRDPSNPDEDDQGGSRGRKRVKGFQMFPVPTEVSFAGLESPGSSGGDSSGGFSGGFAYSLATTASAFCAGECATVSFTRGNWAAVERLSSAEGPAQGQWITAVESQFVLVLHGCTGYVQCRSATLTTFHPPVDSPAYAECKDAALLQFTVPSEAMRIAFNGPCASMRAFTAVASLFSVKSLAQGAPIVEGRGRLLLRLTYDDELADAQDELEEDAKEINPAFQGDFSVHVDCSDELSAVAEPAAVAMGQRLSHRLRTSHLGSRARAAAVTGRWNAYLLWSLAEIAVDEAKTLPGPAVAEALQSDASALNALLQLLVFAAPPASRQVVSRVVPTAHSASAMRAKCDTRIHQWGQDSRVQFELSGHQPHEIADASCLSLLMLGEGGVLHQVPYTPQVWPVHPDSLRVEFAVHRLQQRDWFGVSMDQRRTLRTPVWLLLNGAVLLRTNLWYFDRVSGAEDRSVAKWEKAVENKQMPDNLWLDLSDELGALPAADCATLHELLRLYSSNSFRDDRTTRSHTQVPSLYAAGQCAEAVAVSVGVSLAHALTHAPDTVATRAKLLIDYCQQNRNLPNRAVQQLSDDQQRDVELVSQEHQREGEEREESVRRVQSRQASSSRIDSTATSDWSSFHTSVTGSTFSSLPSFGGSMSSLSRQESPGIGARSDTFFELQLFPTLGPASSAQRGLTFFSAPRNTLFPAMSPLASALPPGEQVKHHART